MNQIPGRYDGFDELQVSASRFVHGWRDLRLPSDQGIICRGNHLPMVERTTNRESNSNIGDHYNVAD